jgi:Dolichyl-phosphate-mannose-protein mannosyltransferase
MPAEADFETRKSPVVVVDTPLRSDRLQDPAALREIVCLAVIGTAILGAIAFRWLDLQRWSLWWDEGFTVWASSLPISRIIPFAKGDNQAPLYYLIQHYWDGLFGTSEFALRSLSALFGTLALPVFYLLGKKVLNSALAVAFAFWLFAFSMKQIWYSREARTYEAASFFALVALYALVVFLEKRSNWAFLLIVLSSSLTLYLHDMMLFYLLGLDVVWLIYPSERKWTRRLREMFLGNICIGMMFLPWVVSLLAQIRSVGGNLYWVPPPTFGSLVTTLRETVGFDVYHLSVFVKKVLPLSAPILKDGIKVGLVALCTVMLGGGLWRVSSTERKKTLSFLAYCLLPIVLVFILGQRMPLFIDRVFTASSVAVPIILAVPLAAQEGRRAKFLFAVLTVVLAGATMLSSFGFIREEQALAKSGENWRGIIATVVTIPAANRLVLFVPPPGEIFFDYYSRNFPAGDRKVARTGLQRDFYDGFPPPKSRIINQADIGRLKTLVESHHYYEIDEVLTHDVDPNGLVASYLSRHFVRQEDLAPSGPIRIIPFRAVSRP